MVYNIDFDIAGGLLSLFIIFYLYDRKGLKSVSNRFFLALVLSDFLAALSDIFSSIHNSYPSPGSLWRQDVWNYIYLASHNAMPLMLLLYILFVLGVGNRIKERYFVLICLPLILDYILLALNPFNKGIFYYDKTGLYLHGPLFTVFWVVAFCYMLASIVVIIYNRKTLPPRKLNPLGLFISICIVTVLIQIMNPYVLIEVFAQTLGLMGILFSIENQDDVINHVSGAYNRYAFLANMGSYGEFKSRMFIAVKLTDLAYYNTSLGVENTNALQKQIAGYLTSLDNGFMCYDIGAGHFVLVESNSKSKNTRELSDKIIKRFESPWGRGSGKMIVPVQICEGILGEDILNMEDFLLVLDSEYDARGDVRVDGATIVEAHRRRILVERLIDEALENNGFSVYYQPIWDRKSGTFHSAEALVRLISGEYGFISPEEFIPISEQNGKIAEIGEFVFDEVCRFYMSAKLNTFGVEYIEVNLSAVQCMNRELPDIFGKILKKYDMDPSRINLEITESASAGNTALLKDNVLALKNMGFSFSLDDYGTGYSNYSYMFDMPFSIIKLDKSILWNAMDPNTSQGDEKFRRLLSDTVSMFKNIGYNTLVEGVESVDQKIYLEDLGCDYFQGYYFSKPVPENVFFDFIKAVNA